MKKQIKTLRLKKQTVSSLEAQLLNGGAPTTNNMATMYIGCVSQLICEPVPQDPRPIDDNSRINPCTETSWNRPGGC